MTEKRNRPFKFEGVSVKLEFLRENDTVNGEGEICESSPPIEGSEADEVEDEVRNTEEEEEEVERGEVSEEEREEEGEEGKRSCSESS